MINLKHFVMLLPLALSCGGDSGGGAPPGQANILPENYESSVGSKSDFLDSIEKAEKEVSTPLFEKYFLLPISQPPSDTDDKTEEANFYDNPEVGQSCKDGYMIATIGARSSTTALQTFKSQLMQMDDDFGTTQLEKIYEVTDLKDENAKEVTFHYRLKRISESSTNTVIEFAGGANDEGIYIIYNTDTHTKDEKRETEIDNDTSYFFNFESKSMAANVVVKMDRKGEDESTSSSSTTTTLSDESISSSAATDFTNEGRNFGGVQNSSVVPLNENEFIIDYSATSTGISRSQKVKVKKDEKSCTITEVISSPPL